MLRAPGRPAARRRHLRGMTLVELMVGLAIGMFLVAVMGAVYVGSRSTFVAQESGARMQENGRFVMDTLGNDLRMAGFRGCVNGSAAQPPVDNTLNTPTTLLYNFNEPVWGSRNNGVSWSPALPAPASGLGADAGGDVLVVRRPYGVGWSLIAEMADPTVALTITPTGAFTQGDLLMVADCVGASVLQATNATPGTAGALAHVAGTAGAVPGVAANALSRTYANDARVWRMQTLIYYLAASQRRTGEMALWSYVNPVYDGQAQLSELATGVQSMAVTYGLNTGGPDVSGNRAADTFKSADQVADWTQVVSARVELVLVGGTEASTTAIQPYVFNGQSVTPTDHRRRAVMSTMVSLRNRLP